MNVMVTGGSGFIGTNLVSDLIKQGHRVLVYDKRRSETYPDLCIVADVRDKKKLEESMHGVDAVYHLAAEHSDNVRPASLYYEVNVGGAENLVHALKYNHVGKLVFTSTVAVYGIEPGEFSEDSPVRPFNDYSWSKYKAEVVFNKWAIANHTNCLNIVRPCVIFGEGNRGNFHLFLSQIAAGRFALVGNGKNRRSLGYVKNISQFLTMLASSNPGRFVYNYADKPDLNMEELVSITRAALGKKRKINLRIPYSIGLLGGFAFDLLAKITGKAYSVSSIRVKKFCVDSRVSVKKLEQTGFVPPYSLTDGLNRMISAEFSQSLERINSS